MDRKQYKYLLLLWLFATVTSNATGQRVTANWVFGHRIHLSFDDNNNVSASFNKLPISGGEGSACISDSNGILLLYTDGINLWNKKNNLVTSGLKGSLTSTQSSLILKEPISDNTYFVITNNIDKGLYYSVVNTDSVNGFGKVLQKNVLLWPEVNEKLTACYHRNKTDIWIISHSLKSNQFLVFLLTKEGIKKPVISKTGYCYSGRDYIGTLKVSPNGKYLVNVVYLETTAELFLFNDSSGKVCFANLISDKLNGLYGAEFSFDNSKVLLSSLAGINSRIYVYNVNNVKANANTVADTIFNTNRVGAAIQLANDSDVWITGYKFLGKVITKHGTLLLNDTFIKIPSPFNLSSLGMPNFNQSFFNRVLVDSSVNIECNNVECNYGQTAFFIPNIITPNNDGTNDYLSFEDYEFSYFDIKIFNRWGELVFSSNNSSERFYGEHLPPSVYIVLLQYSLNLADPADIKEYTGTLTLLR